MAVAVKKFNKNDLSYTCTLIFIPNHLTGGRTTQARDYRNPSGVTTYCKRCRCAEQSSPKAQQAKALSDGQGGLQSIRSMIAPGADADAES